jgi:ankyrin repeat protein
MTLLMYAATHGNVEQLQALIDCGADINARNSDGETALMRSVVHGHMQCHPILISAMNIFIRID